MEGNTPRAQSMGREEAEAEWSRLVEKRTKSRSRKGGSGGEASSPQRGLKAREIRPREGRRIVACSTSTPRGVSSSNSSRHSPWSCAAGHGTPALRASRCVFVYRCVTTDPWRAVGLIVKQGQTPCQPHEGVGR